MATAPFIRPLQVTGGTFYSFTAADDDLGLTFNNTNIQFRFSKFVLLNIPTIRTPAFVDNGIQFAAIDGAMLQGLDPDNNINFAQSFQNYCLNLESIVLSQSTYDRTIKAKATERIFFKWLKELGAIRYQPANNLQSTLNQLTDPRFVEETTVTTGPLQYNSVVQYIGDINIVNTVQNNVNAFSEIYIYVPVSDGNTPLVLFQCVADVNYGPDMMFQNKPANPLDTNVLNGRHYNDVNPSGLSIQAIYDQAEIGSPTSMFYNSISGHFDIPERWYDPRSALHTYYTDAVFNDPTNDYIQKSLGLEVVTYKRSRLDGVQIDFTTTDYKPIVDNPSLHTIQEYNSTVDAQPFEFNAVMIYYDLFDPNNPADVATNLYGVLFLEDVQQEALVFGIPTFQKFIPNAVTGLNGNSYGLKQNIKFDTSIDTVAVEKAVNDYNNFSLDLYVDALNALQNAATILTAQQQQVVAMQTQLNNIEDLVLNTTSVNEITQRLTNLENSFQANQALFSNTTDIVNMINTVSGEITQLLQGQTSVTVSYNIDVVKQGAGIFVDRSVPNQITINNSNETFNISVNQTVPYIGDLSSGGTITLQPFGNYFRHSTNGLTVITSGDIYVKIDDTNTRWAAGQTLRLVFDDILDLNTNNLILQTDAQNRLGAGAYGILIGTASGANFTTAGDRPIFDITCVDPVNLLFLIDQIR